MARSSLHILSSELVKEPPLLCAMWRGKALVTWAFLTSLATSSWGIQGKSPGVSRCPQAAAVLCPAAETGCTVQADMVRGDPQRGVLHLRDPAQMVRRGARPARCSGSAVVPVGHSLWSLETATRIAYATGISAAVAGWLGNRPLPLAGVFRCGTLIRGS